MVNLFAHRGFWYEYNQQNTIASLKNAHDEGFCGIEFDIWFCPNHGLVISHDEVTCGKTYPDFSQFLQFGNDFKYWIDFKNLNLLNAKQIFEIAKRDIKSAKIDSKNIFIAPFIDNYRLAGEIYKIALEVFKEELNFAAMLEYEEDKDELIDFVKNAKIKYLSISYELVDEKLIKTLKNLEFFVWTINDLKIISKLQKMGIKYFITDKITPQIYARNIKQSRT